MESRLCFGGTRRAREPSYYLATDSRYDTDIISDGLFDFIYINKGVSYGMVKVGKGTICNV